MSGARLSKILGDDNVQYLLNRIRDHHPNLFDEFDAGYKVSRAKTISFDLLRYELQRDTGVLMPGKIFYWLITLFSDQYEKLEDSTKIFNNDIIFFKKLFSGTL